MPPAARRWHRAWRVGRYGLGLGLGGLAVWAVAGKSGELSGASSYLTHLRWWWVGLATAAEALSYLALARMQRRLLSAGQVRVPLLPIAGITLGESAILGSLPAGIVLSAAYAFRQYRRFGADDMLAGWVVVGVAGLSFVTLTALAAVGLALALGTGSALDLVEVILGIAVVASLTVIAWANRSWVTSRAVLAVRASQRVLHRPVGDPHRVVLEWQERISAVSPTRADWVWTATMGFGNWMADCACLALAFSAVGASVPWRGLLLAYGAAQLAATLPITPGGLGVVEGSLTVALVTFGGARASTVAAVLVYRLLSFWLLLPVGWSAWAILNLTGRAAAGRAAAGRTTAVRRTSASRIASTPTGPAGADLATAAPSERPPT